MMTSHSNTASIKAEQSLKNVNYSKWARTQSQTPTGTRKPTTQQFGVTPYTESGSGFTPSNGNDIRLPPVAVSKTFVNEEDLDSSRSAGERIPLIERIVVSKNPNYGHSCSSKCHHSWLPSAVREEEDVEEYEEYLRELEIAIAKKTEQLQRLRRLHDNVLSGNIRHLDVIEAEENDIFSGADHIVSHYNKLESVARNLRKLANEEIIAAQREYDALKAKLDSELSEAQAEVDFYASRVSEARENLKVLKGYKDKEHAVNQLRINKLTSELEQLRVDNIDSLKDLQAKLSNRHNIQLKSFDGLKDETRIKSVVHLMKQVPEPIQDMARENKHLAEEIEAQKALLLPLRKEVLRLQTELKKQKSERTSIKQCMFPELFKVYQKCSPDMDVVLNIPTQKKLPV